MTDPYFAGVDIGSSMTKVVILGEDVAATVVGPTGAEHRKLANKVMEEALRKAGLVIDDITYVVATGYGRINVPFADKQITEISCHARGVNSLLPSASTVIEIGGQDSKGIRTANGMVTDFVMNDKCAAGTGRYLEVMAEALGVELSEMGGISLRSEKKVNVSSTCTIFAEQEVISLLGKGVPIEDILAGLNHAIASRVCGMVKKIKIAREVAFTGGGAKNVGLIAAIENTLGFAVLTPQDPLLTGALGAALLARVALIDAADKGLVLERKAHKLEEATLFDGELQHRASC